jgi:hypothetical protein
MELLTRKMNASAFKKRADQKNLCDLSPLFEIMGDAADMGDYEVDIKEELTEIQVRTLEELNFEVYFYDEDDEQYSEGYRSSISWANAEPENDSEEE